MFIAALFIIARTWKQPRCPLTGEWRKMWYKKDKIILFAVNTDGPRDCHTE